MLRIIYDKYLRDFRREHGKTLLFSRQNPFIYSKPVLQKLGKIYFVNDAHLTPTSILTYIKKNKIDRVLFSNPYTKKHVLELYKSIKENGIPFIISERGALRDSVFFDWNGFNAESSSYSEKNWNKPLSEDKLKIVDDYMHIEKSIPYSLERQPNHKKLSLLKEELNIIDKKILFVPLQRPSDSVVQYFCGDIGCYDNFITLVNEVAVHLPSNWVVVVKKHPLEDKLPSIDRVIFSEANIKDLICLSDFILLINSGVGLLSMLWTKPVLYAGEVFYNHDDINRKVLTYRDVLSIIEDDFQPKKEIISRFLYFLLMSFYSFGTFTTREIKHTNNSRLTMTTSIDFYQIKNLDINDHY